MPGGVGEDRQSNVQRAMDCYEAALHVCTPTNFSCDWAMIQHLLGNTYRDLPEREEQQQVNLHRAIDCYEAAQQVFTREAFPANWAEIQNDVGTAYCTLSEDCPVNLRKAVECYHGALEVYRSLGMDFKIKEASRNLEKAEQRLSPLL